MSRVKAGLKLSKKEKVMDKLIKKDKEKIDKMMNTLVKKDKPRDAALKKMKKGKC